MTPEIKLVALPINPVTKPTAKLPPRATVNALEEVELLEQQVDGLGVALEAQGDQEGTRLRGTLVVLRGGTEGQESGRIRRLAFFEERAPLHAEGQSGPGLERGLATRHLLEELTARLGHTGEGIVALAGTAARLREGDQRETLDLLLAFLGQTDQLGADRRVDVVLAGIGVADHAEGNGTALLDLALLLGVAVAALEDDLGDLLLDVLQTGDIVARLQQARHRDRGVGPHEPVAGPGVRTLLARVEVVDQEGQLGLARRHVHAVAVIDALGRRRRVVDHVDRGQAQGGHGRDLDVARGEFLLGEQVHQVLGDVLAQGVVARAVADQAQAVRREGARAVGDFVGLDELAALGHVAREVHERLDRTLVGEDAEGQGRGLRDFLHAVVQEPVEDLHELRVAALVGPVTDLGEGDHRAREDVVVLLGLEGLDQGRDDASTDERLVGTLRVLGLGLLALAEEERVTSRLDRIAPDARLDVEVRLLVEAPPELPQGEVGAARAAEGRRGLGLGRLTCSGAGRRRTRRAGGRGTGGAGTSGAGGARGTAAATTAATGRDRVARTAIGTAVGRRDVLQADEAGCDEGAE